MALAAWAQYVLDNFAPVAGHKRRFYFFESVLTPNVFWVDMNRVDFSERTGKVRKLDLGPNQTNVHAGAVNDAFRNSAPFVFLGL